MIILDTNIISELMKAKPEPKVLAWADKQPEQPVVTTAITSAEIYAGINALPDGKRKTELNDTFGTILLEVIDEVLPFDQAAAEAYGVLTALLRRNGTPVGQSDAMIAAIVLAHGGTLVTRNIKDFLPCGIEVINPFGD
jgi:predicted nucleic acid-binding protein